jgi:hypothetical protein
MFIIYCWRGTYLDIYRKSTGTRHLFLVKKYIPTWLEVYFFTRNKCLWENNWHTCLISLRLGFRRNFLSVSTPRDQNRYGFWILLQPVSKLKVDVKYLLCICKHILYGLFIGFKKIFIKQLKNVQAVYMGFWNYNKIFDIDILNLETGCNKIRDDFDHVV